MSRFLALSCCLLGPAVLVDATCTPSPPEDPNGDVGYWLLGLGQCVDSFGNTSSAFACPESPCPPAADMESCHLLCAMDDGCTGFELRTANLPLPTSPLALHCFIFVAQPIFNHDHPTEPWPWVKVNGTQPLDGRAVVTVNAAVVDSCCYKIAYPRPNPSLNPVKMPPVQSGTQKAIFANLSAQAAQASETATPALLELVDFCAANATYGGKPYHMFNASYCPGLADLTNGGTTAEYPTGQQIIQRFSEEVRAAEYGHGYGVLSPIMDPNDNFNPSYPFMLNLYEPCALGINTTNADGHCGMTKVGGGGGPNYDPIQQLFFDSKPFKTGNPPTNFAEARDRIIYTAMNYKQSPIGNSLYFGFWDAMIRPKAIEESVLFTVTDSYHYWKQYPNCVGWPNCTVGTMADHYHTLYSWMTGGGPVGAPYTKSLVPANCITQMDYLTSMVCKRPPTRNNPTGVCPTVPTSFTSYWESDVLGTIQYPNGVKFIIASFYHYFGEITGLQLREWCKHWGWVLVWTLHDGTTCLDPHRLMDPAVLPSTTANATLPATFAPAFEVMWSAANATRLANKGAFTTYETVWKNFINAAVTPGVGEALLWNIGVRDCADYNNCIGITNQTGACVCYKEA